MSDQVRKRRATALLYPITPVATGLCVRLLPFGLSTRSPWTKGLGYAQPARQGRHRRQIAERSKSPRNPTTQSPPTTEFPLEGTSFQWAPRWGAGPILPLPAMQAGARVDAATHTSWTGNGSRAARDCYVHISFTSPIHYPKRCGVATTAPASPFPVSGPRSFTSVGAPRPRGTVLRPVGVRGPKGPLPGLGTCLPGTW
uniref:Uncharacterized protein n=1 Tax=Trichogramma kaykai TaxID=54128 RepID=A0ABD2XR69_9HYME